jgi:hypothetical protein
LRVCAGMGPVPLNLSSCSLSVSLSITSFMSFARSCVHNNPR